MQHNSGLSLNFLPKIVLLDPSCVRDPRHVEHNHACALAKCERFARSAGPGAAGEVIASAISDYPLTKSLPFEAAQLEVAFWQEIRHGRARAARIIAGKLTAMPNPHGRTEFEFRCALSCRRAYRAVCMLPWHLGSSRVPRAHPSLSLRGRALRGTSPAMVATGGLRDSACVTGHGFNRAGPGCRGVQKLVCM